MDRYFVFVLCLLVGISGTTQGATAPIIVRNATTSPTLWDDLKTRSDIANSVVSQMKTVGLELETRCVWSTLDTPGILPASSTVVSDATLTLARAVDQVTNGNPKGPVVSYTSKIRLAVLSFIREPPTEGVIACAVFNTAYNYSPYAYRSKQKISQVVNLSDESSSDGNATVNQALILHWLERWKAFVASDNQSMSLGKYSMRWTLPYVDCIVKQWVVSLVVSIMNGDEDNLKTLVITSISVKSIDINQCESKHKTMFSNTHKCDRNTMRCVPNINKGFILGAYSCYCHVGYMADGVPGRELLDGSMLENEFQKYNGGSTTFFDNFRCIPCQENCSRCFEVGGCQVSVNSLFRALPLGCQAFCITVTMVMSVVIFTIRKDKAISSSMWTMLEMILLGAVLLYSSTVVHYFHATTITCILEPWFREIGFAIFYGAIILKMYKILVEFRTRKAHRWVVKDKDLLKYLAGIIVIVLGYIAAWTATILDQGRYNGLISSGRTAEGEAFISCECRWWEYVTETGEILFLLLGITCSWGIRNSDTDQEKVSLCVSVYIEFLFSTGFYIARHILILSFHPDYMFLLIFLRCQLTVTINLILIFGPKLWYHNKPSDKHQRSQSTNDILDRPESLKLHDGGHAGGELDIAEINISEMDPEDIQAELKRVYTQLEVLRNKTMRKDNPHISKRRGGRKPTHRRFSLQVKNRHRSFYHSHHRDHGEHSDVEKALEESLVSNDPVSNYVYPDGLSTVSDIVPSVSFRMKK